MYHISQLNDLLVPELQDIAIEQNISNAKKLGKQELISQILNKQNTMNNADGEKPKRKRILKPAAESKADVTPAEEKAKPEARVKKPEPVVTHKAKPVKKEIEIEEEND